MPTYEAQCEVCNKYQEYICPVAERYDTPTCCGQRMAKVIFNAPAVYSDMNDFHTENGGKGRFHPQLQTHVTSVDDAIDKAEKRGWSVLDKA